jgi:ATP/maltotriose-dependent transcriptional regulator MalT
MVDISKIIGRTKEKAELHLALDQVRDGQGKLLLIGGEAGVGKTRLIDEVLAHSGLRTITSRAKEETNPPYSIITSILRTCLSGGGVEKFDCGPLTKYLALILPELGKPPKDVDGETLKEAIKSALFNISSNKPTAIFLDDLHWADNATLDFLAVLSSELKQSYLFIIGTFRSDEVTRGHRFRKFKTELRRSRNLNELLVEPLGIDDTRSLINDLIDGESSPNFVQQIFNQTQGLPLFIEEMIFALTGKDLIQETENGIDFIPDGDIPVPESIKDAILQHLNILSEDAREQLEVASIAGSEFDLNLVTGLTGKETGIDELFERNLFIEIENNSAAFRHAMIRESVKSEIMWSRRRSLHKQIAEYLEKINSPPELTAEHWVAANELDKARTAFIKSVEHCSGIYAYNDAMVNANRALDIWPEEVDENSRIKILQILAHCCQISGKLNDSIRALKGILESPSAIDHHKLLGEINRSLAAVYGLSGSWELSASSRINSAEEFVKAGLPDEAASEYLAAAGRYVGMMQTNIALDAVQKSIELAGQADRIDIKAKAMGLSGNILSMQGKFEQGRGLVQEALSLALNNNETDAASIIYRRLASALEYASDYLSARDAYYNAYDYCVTQGKDVSAQICMSCMSYTLFQTGEWKKSLEFCREVITSKNTPENSMPIGHGMMGLVFAFRGETKKAIKSLKESLRLSRKLEITAAELLFMWGLAIVHENESDDASALENYRSIITLWEKTQDRHDVIPALIWASRLFAANKLEKETTQCAEVLASIASATGNQEAMAALAYTLGEKALLNDNIDEAITQFSQALDHLDKLEIPLEQLYIEFRLGTVLKQKGSDKDSIKHLNNALSISRKLGTRPYSSKINEELNLLGVTSKESRKEDSEERTDKAGLTRRQSEILELLAQGLTNKEIAEKLFLSKRTVDMHVSHILERLNCRSRMEAMNKAKELGLL